VSQDPVPGTLNIQTGQHACEWWPEPCRYLTCVRRQLNTTGTVIWSL